MAENQLDIAKQLFENQENIILMYAFNSTGKTRLSVAYKDYSKNKNGGDHAGVYYNAFSEDLFVWENDDENTVLNINYSNLSQFHSFLDVKDIEEKLAIYNPKYKFDFNLDTDPERGIESITFYVDEENKTPIKISRGEERIFVWCFFLALFEVETWVGEQDAHLFIDDPVSSLDEHNIFVTAESIFDLIEASYLKKRIIISTHHIGLFSILFNWLKKGDRSAKYKELTKACILGNKNGNLELKSPSGDVFLYHLHLIQTLAEAQKEQLFKFHIVLLRQVLENIASFLGSARPGFVLSEIGVDDTAKVMDMLNSLSHKNAYQFQINVMSEDEETLFNVVFDKLLAKYNFKF
ncbi:MAG: anticodon nuclease [Bacteroidetes bacterium]|nr:MAG: anticodon nuclease [Bacteroidota bacterium]